jgi:hypothetical protein
LAPDLERGTVILVDPAGLEETRHIYANNWNLPRVLNHIYTFPEHWEWDDQPRVYRLLPDWKERIWVEGTTFQVNEATTLAPSAYYRTTSTNNVILLAMDESQLVRVGPELIIEGQTFSLKWIEKISAPDFPQGVLFPLLIDESH